MRLLRIRTICLALSSLRRRRDLAPVNIVLFKSFNQLQGKIGQQPLFQILSNSSLELAICNLFVIRCEIRPTPFNCFLTFVFQATILNKVRSSVGPRPLGASPQQFHGFHILFLFDLKISSVKNVYM